MRKDKKKREQRKNVLTVITFTMAAMASHNIFEYLANMLQNSKYFGLLLKAIDKILPHLRHTLLDTAYKLSFRCEQHHLL